MSLGRTVCAVALQKRLAVARGSSRSLADSGAALDRKSAKAESFSGAIFHARPDRDGRGADKHAESEEATLSARVAR